MPLVKCISGNLNSVSFIGFHFTKGIIIKDFDKFWVDSTDKKVCRRKLMGKDFIIPFSMLHYDSGFTNNRVDEFYRRIDVTGCVFDFKINLLWYDTNAPEAIHPA